MATRWLTPRALVLHGLVAVVTPLCLVAFWWQLHQALDGNSLSWAYTVEWPFFAAIAVIGWWQLVHEDGSERAARAERAGRSLAHLDGEAAADPARANSPIPAVWSEAATLDGAPQETAESYAGRVAVAARQEYLDHLARMSERDSAAAWKNPAGMP